MDEKMGKTEEKLLESIRRSAKETEIPEGLKPENIEKQLKGKNTKKKWRRYGVRITEMAAVVLLAFTVYNQMPDMQRQKTAEMQLAATQAEEAETLEMAQAEETETPGMTVQADGEGNAEFAADEADMQEADGSEPESVQEKNETRESALEGGENTLVPVGTSAALFQKLWDYKNIQMVSGALYGARRGTGEWIEEEAEIMPLYETVKDMDTGSTQASAATGAESTADFSQTNLREAGVDEGDTVKTDGSYLYVLRKDRTVEIIRIDGAQMEQVSSIEPANLQESIRDLYLDGDRLILVTTATESKMQKSQEESEEDVYKVQEYTYTKIRTYDISNREQPRLAGETAQEGYYRGSRKAGDYVYLFTEYEPQLEKTEGESRIMPLAGGSEVSAEKIYVPEIMESSRYLVIASVNIRRPSAVVDSAAVVSGAGNFYVSKDSIFICNEKWDGYADQVTEILKFSYADGKIAGTAAGQVKGYLNDTFSLDEYRGYLRLVVTSWNDGEEINSLYVLDENLEAAGKITDIAPGETIRSARFLGDTAYFVTFRQTDPLFSVDLSNPTDPVLLGELKISGFSSYLHLYGEDLLLGIGYEADEDTGVTTGLKLSMFDISDPSDVREQKKYVVEEASYCPGLMDYKAIMIDPSKNLFGFVCDGQYLVFSYDEKEGFVNELNYTLEEEKGATWYLHAGDRGLYAGDTFYLVSEEKILAFAMEDSFAVAGRLDF